MSVRRRQQRNSSHGEKLHSFWGSRPKKSAPCIPTVSVPPAAGLRDADESFAPPPVQATRRIAARKREQPRRAITRERTPRPTRRPRRHGPTANVSKGRGSGSFQLG